MFQGKLYDFSVVWEKNDDFLLLILKTYICSRKFYAVVCQHLSLSRFNQERGKGTHGNRKAREIYTEERVLISCLHSDVRKLNDSSFHGLRIQP